MLRQNKMQDLTWQVGSVICLELTRGCRHQSLWKGTSHDVDIIAHKRSSARSEARRRLDRRRLLVLAQRPLKTKRPSPEKGDTHSQAEPWWLVGTELQASSPWSAQAICFGHAEVRGSIKHWLSLRQSGLYATPTYEMRSTAKRSEHRRRVRNRPGKRQAYIEGRVRQLPRAARCRAMIA